PAVPALSDEPAGTDDLGIVPQGVQPQYLSALIRSVDGHPARAPALDVGLEAPHEPARALQTLVIPVVGAHALLRWKKIRATHSANPAVVVIRQVARQTICHHAVANDLLVHEPLLSP